MIRTCPKCGDYYADASLAFCLADGTPLVDVEPLGENWSEGARVIEEKGNALRKQKRRLKWRRFMLSAMTTLIVVMVVCVVVVNSLIYLQPAVTPNPIMEPIAAEIATPTWDTKPPAPSPTLPPPPKCSVADKSREQRIIIDKCDVEWQRIIESDQLKIIAENMPVGVANANGWVGSANVEATLGPIEHEIKFPEMCTASVTARYAWQVKKSLNGRITDVSIPGEKRFACAKTGERWRCS